MSQSAFIALTAERVEAGPVRVVGGTLQQQTRLFHAGQCVCVLLVTYPPGSPEWERWHAAQRLDESGRSRREPATEVPT